MSGGAPRQETQHFAMIVSDLAGGGAEKAMLKIAALLTGRGHHIDMILLEERCDHTIPPGLQIRALGRPGAGGHGWLGKRLLARRLRRALRGGEGYDVIVSTLPFADEIARLAQLPRHWCRIANTLGAEIHRLEQKSATKAARRRQRYSRVYADQPLIAVSEGVARDLRTSLALKSRIEIIPNPFDLADIRLRAQERVASLPPRPYAIHVGRFAAQKRHDLLLDAWQQMPTAPPLVLLAAPDPRLEAMIAERGLSQRVHVAGFQTNPYPWIAGASLLVLCSDHEGLPNVLLEALACGTPVVSTDCPSGPAEILAPFPQCLVPPGDAPALAQAISVVLANPPDLSSVDFAPYSPERVASAWEALAQR